VAAEGAALDGIPLFEIHVEAELFDELLHLQSLDLEDFRG
jgi:hypothetical protein